jgi:hypothetical protein
MITTNRKKNPHKRKQLSKKEKEDIVSAALGRKGTVIHR